MSLEGVIAVNHFGLGAGRGEVEHASADPRQWLIDQLGPADQPAALMNDMAARFNLGFTTERPFAERLVWFWSNHFTVSFENAGVASLAGAYEREAIRPHIAGKFEDMLLAVASHPAMLIYLNNNQSIGPDSPAGQSGKNGLNENFGRELMELHSLGVDGGYNQDDVIALARLLTGWSLGIGPYGAKGGERVTDSGVSKGFRYFPDRHEPGAISLRGKIYPEGFAGGRAAIRDLAHDPATARFIAVKFARHFIGDAPPPESVERLEKTFNSSGGDLRALAVTAVEDPAAWAPATGKMRTPVEYITACYRLLGLPGRNTHAAGLAQEAMQVCGAMGHLPWSAPAPNGWSDQSADWSGPEAVLLRAAWARQLGMRSAHDVTAHGMVALADSALGPRISPITRAAMTSAANGGEALALLLCSPEFQRR